MSTNRKHESPAYERADCRAYQGFNITPERSEELRAWLNLLSRTA